MKDLPKDRLLELLADQTIFGLSAEEMVELEDLKKQFPEWEKDFSLELTAAAIGLSSLNVSDDLPANLRAKIFANAEEFFAPRKESQTIAGIAPPAENVVNVVEVTRKRPFWQWLGWGVAAAACIALAINLWLTRKQNQPEIAKNSETVQTPEVVATPEVVKTPEIVPTPQISPAPDATKTPEPVKSPETITTPGPAKTPEPTRTPEAAATPTPVRTPAPGLTAAQRREQLIASAPDVIQTNWTSAKGDKSLSGDVVWSNAQQTGYVRLRGMQVLDASRETYQLWVIDDERNEKIPISAGVFNVSGAGEIIVPINAQLRVIKPKQFAISKEKAGGVVITKPDRIVAVAKV